MKIIRKDENGTEIEAPRVECQYPMVQVIAEGNNAVRQNAAKQGRSCSPVYATDYPISGGWGYTQDDACVIKMKGKMSDRSLLLSERDGYTVENLFIERRIYEEIISYPAPDTPDLHGLRWKVEKQSLHTIGNRNFDEITVTVSGYLFEDFKSLRTDWKAQMMANSRQIYYSTTYWFDVTSFV